MYYFQFIFTGRRDELGRGDPLVQIPGSGGSRGRPHPGHDAPPPRRLLHRAPGPGRADLLGAEQPPEVLRAHAQVVERAATDLRQNYHVKKETLKEETRVISNKRSLRRKHKSIQAFTEN